MSNFKISKQTEAQDDSYLIECFQDTGLIKDLINSSFSIVSGRTGSGKTAIAKYLEKKGTNYGIDYTYRMSIRNISLSPGDEGTSRLNSILLYVVVKIVQQFLKKRIFTSHNEKFWKDFMVQNGYQDILDYNTFVEAQKSKKRGYAFKGLIGNFLAKASAGIEENKESISKRSIISKAPSYLFDQLKDTFPDNLSVFIFIDDISDYLDNIDSEGLERDVAVIKELLFYLNDFNLSLRDSDKNLRVVSLFRDDLFKLVKGSSTNKLISNSIKIEWNEMSFARLLMRRLPYFEGNLDGALSDPINEIKKQFPDQIFSDTLKNFGTRGYSTYFYAYMMAISFNRPRDFLNFCYALRDRLSNKKPVVFANIESAEIEYSSYFRQELKDELFLAGRILDYNVDQDHINDLIDALSSDDGLSSAALRTNLAQYLGEKTSLGKKKIEFFIEELWRYGILGYRAKNEKVINFNYFSDNIPFSILKIKKYIFFMHRGLWWFTKKRKNK